MTDQTAQEPTMEEILASICRIISEDDAPAETAAAASEPVAEIEPEPAPVFEAAAETPAPVEEEVLELTERYEAPAAESIGDLDVADVAPFPAPVAAPEPVVAPGDALVGESAAASAASAFAGLAATFQKPEAPVAAPQDMPFVSGNTVEAMVQSMLRPMLKDWLDANLPAIVETQVRKEVERIARNAG